jgi:DDE superfamily endonuclease
VAAMEDVLDLYEEPYDPAYPTVCLDEKPVVLHTQTRSPLPAQPGAVECRDYEYVRQGTGDLFVMVEPLVGWRHVAVTQRRTRLDFAECLRYLVEERYPDAEYVRLVVDNLNTHVPAALYEAFPPQRAREILERLEFHYTPKHGSWLNMAEIEISVFERGCLSRPVGDLSTLRQRVNALEEERNAARATIHWQFTSQQARVTLADLYPVTENKPD